MTDTPEKPGKRFVREGIKGAKPAKASRKAAGTAPDYLTSRFEMTTDGLFKLVKKPDEDGDRRTWVCAPFKIEAETIEQDDGGWGVLLSWQDRDGVSRQEVFSRAHFAGDCGDLRARLASGGLAMNAAPQARQALAEFLSLASSPVRALCIAKIGWHQVGDGRVYVLPPDEVFGTVKQRIVLQLATREPSPFIVAGSLESWRQLVGEPSIGNTRMVFALSAAFAGPLLELVGEDSGGFHLRGPSRIGKTTLLRIAASVWGDPSRFVRSWRATGNGLESIAAAANDSVLLLDEMGQVDANELAHISYMLANGQGKSRSSRDGSLRTASRWQLIFLSSGEIGAVDKNLEVHRPTRAGEEVRMIELHADADTGHGAFEDLHEAETAEGFIQALRLATTDHHGVAGRSFLRHLVDQLARDPGIALRMRVRIDDMTAELLQLYPGAGGQVRSVARRFALVAIAGEIASEAYVTGWSPREPRLAAHALFGTWLEGRGTIGAREDDQAVTQLKDFVRRYSGSRFDIWSQDRAQDNAQQSPQSTPPREQAQVRDRAGWKKWQADSDGGYWIFYLTAGGMHDALAGLDFNAALRTLTDRGVLRPGRGSASSQSLRPPGFGKMRLYEVIGSGVRTPADDTD